jgi:hypothetical protein
MPIFIYDYHPIGIINLPVLWFLVDIRHGYQFTSSENACLRSLLLAMLLIGLSYISTIALNAGIFIRYSVEFFWIFTLPALICAYSTYQINSADSALARIALKRIYIFCAVSIIIRFFLSFIPRQGFFIGSAPINYNYLPICYYLQNLFSI